MAVRHISVFRSGPAWAWEIRDVESSELLGEGVGVSYQAGLVAASKVADDLSDAAAAEMATIAGPLEDVAGNILSEVQAQLDDLSDDTEDAIAKYPEAAERIRAAVERLRFALTDAVHETQAEWFAAETEAGA